FPTRRSSDLLIVSLSHTTTSSINKLIVARRFFVIRVGCRLLVVRITGRLLISTLAIAIALTLTLAIPGHLLLRFLVIRITGRLVGTFIHTAAVTITAAIFKSIISTGSITASTITYISTCSIPASTIIFQIIFAYNTDIFMVEVFYIKTVTIRIFIIFTQRRMLLLRHIIIQ